MLRSMTGYGGAQALVEGVDYGIEVRSVNGRYFKASIRLPEVWAGAEAEIDKLLRAKLSRGSVQFSLRMRLASEAAAYSVNVAALQRYVDQAREALGADATLDAGAMLMLPGVCEPPSSEDICDRTRQGLWAAIEEAVNALVEMRRIEGESLQADLMTQCDAIATQLEVIVPRTSCVVEDFNKRLLARVNELVNSAKITVSEQDLTREVAVFAERSDINEEISRLRSHIDQFRQVCQQTEQAGRKLDFIAQEMLREANTIGSKANDAEIGRAIVEIKTAVDRIKEQVQNAE